MNIVTKTIVAAIVLAAASASALGQENIDGTTITSVKTADNWIWDDYSVTASAKIVRNVKPTQRLCFKVWLVESDIAFDELFGPNIISIPPSAWSQRTDGRWQAGFSTTFKGISDYYGTDWTLRGKYVRQVPCPQKHARLGGHVGESGGQYAYVYDLENDPTAVGLDPNAMIVHLTVGCNSFALNPPLAVGQSVTLTAPLTASAPPNDDEFEPNPSVVPWIATYSDGTIVRGLTVGPDEPTQFPGNGADCDLLVSISGDPDPAPSGMHVALGGDIIALELRSPQGTLLGAPFALVASIGMSPFPLMLPGDFAPSVWLNPSTAVLLIDGLSNEGALFSPVLTADAPFAFQVPPFVLGSVDLMVQALVRDPGSNLVGLAVSDGELINIP